MAQSVGFHEPESRLKIETIEKHRALTSIQEELEAVDWYAQRVDATTDPDLAAVLAHNRDEEKEHAAMALEWLRRHDPMLDKHLRTYLFTSGSITELEHEEESGGASSASDSSGSLGIGSLKGSGK